MDAKKFFLSCVVLSVLIISGNLIYRIYNKPSDFSVALPAKSSFDYEIPFRETQQKIWNIEITGCYGPVEKVDLKIRAEVILAKKFLPKGNLSGLWHQAAKMQTKYLFGLFNLDKSRPGQKIYLRAEENQIHIKSVSNTLYPSSIVIENHWFDEPVNDYQAKAFQIKSVIKGEPAVSIAYEVSVSAVSCGALTAPSAAVIYPKDPFLAYWQIPTNQSKLVNYEGSKTLINPCADDEMAGIKQAKWFWYTWSPFSNSCQAAIKKDPFYKNFVGHMKSSRMQNSVKNFFNNQEGRDVSLIFGTLNSQSLNSTIKAMKMNLNKDNLFEGFQIFSKLNQSRQIRDDSVLPFMAFLKEVPFLMKVQNIRFDWIDEQSLRIIIVGRQSNGKVLTLNIFYGVTSIEYYPAQSYLRFTLNAFEKSDFIFYVGHAGMGKNFSLQNLAEKAGLPPREVEQKIITKKDQGFFIVSCYSTIYFGEDIQSVRSKAGLKTLMVRSASQHYLTYVSVGMLNFLRQSDLNKYSLKSFLEPVDLGENIIIDYYGIK